MKNNQIDSIGNLGIGVFGFLSIIEFSNLIEQISQHTLIITNPSSILTLWLPDIISLIVFSILLIWSIKKVKTSTKINTRKTVIGSIVLFFGIIVLQFIYSFIGTEFLFNNFSKEFDSYVQIKSANIDLQVYIVFNSILKYLIFAILLLMERKRLPN